MLRDERWYIERQIRLTVHLQHEAKNTSISWNNSCRSWPNHLSVYPFLLWGLKASHYFVFSSSDEILMTETTSDICGHYIPLPLLVIVEICQITTDWICLAWLHYKLPAASKTVVRIPGECFGSAYIIEWHWVSDHHNRLTSWRACGTWRHHDCTMLLSFLDSSAINGLLIFTYWFYCTTDRLPKVA